MRRLKVGVVGGGVGQGHIDAYHALPEHYEVAAFCDIDPAKAAAVAAKNGIPKTVHKLEALLGLDLDLIDLSTPSNLHFPQALEMLKAGKNVVVEKPLAPSLGQVDMLIKAEAISGKRILPIFQYRFGHGVAKLRHLKSKGLTGRLSVATAETHWRRTKDYYDRGAWRGLWSSELGGCLTTHAIHIHDLLMQVLGPVQTVYAQAERSVNGNETEDTAILALGFRQGGLATSSVTLGAHPQSSRLKFCFEGVTAESCLDPYNPGHEPWTFTHSSEAGQLAIDAALAEAVLLPEGFVGQFSHLHAALTEGKPLPVTIEDSRASIELLTASYWSILTAESVTLPILPDHPFYNGWTDTMRRVFADGKP